MRKAKQQKATEFGWLAVYKHTFGRKTISVLILCDMRGRGCYIVCLGIKRQQGKESDIKLNKEKAGGEMSSSTEDLQRTMICQKHLLTYTSG